MDTINTASSAQWGHCEDCKWWQHQQAPGGDPAAVGRCDQPELIRFELQVSAQSGCNHHEARMEPAHRMAGAGAK